MDKDPIRATSQIQWFEYHSLPSFLTSGIASLSNASNKVWLAFFSSTTLSRGLKSCYWSPLLEIENSNRLLLTCENHASALGQLNEWGSGTLSRKTSAFQFFPLVRDGWRPRGAYTSRLSKFCSKTSSENLYREGFPAKLQFFHTNLATRRCYWHNNRYTIGWPNPVLSY